MLRVREARYLFTKLRNSRCDSEGGRMRDVAHEPIVPISAAAPPPGSKYERLIERAKQLKPAKTVVAYPCDETSLRGPMQAAEIGLIEPILVGPSAKITSVARQFNIDISS